MTSDNGAVLYTKEGPLAYLTLNRPEALNAFNADIWQGLDDGLARAQADNDVRIVIVRGNGRAFGAGADLKGRPAASPDDAPTAHGDPVDDAIGLHESMNRYERIFNNPKPIIAQVHGYCLGVASQLAVMCDITVVAEDARIGLPSLPLGGGWISPMWSWLIGPKRAKEMSFTVGAQISGKTASEWGWANRAVPAADLESTVREMALNMAKLPSKFLHLKKISINRQMDIQGFTTGVRMGAEIDALLHATDTIDVVRGSIRSNGLRDTIEKFNSGELKV
jgi:enoyl-CoA hydratase